jgi:hypothetical protein
MKNHFGRQLRVFMVCLVFLAGCGFSGWKTAETKNLTIYYKPGSYAEQHLSEAKQVYEGSFLAAEQFLPKINKEPKLKVYLYDLLESKGYSLPSKREVHYRYTAEFRLTSVHEMMHIFLFELNPNAPLRLEEGLCRLQEGKRKKFQGQYYEIKYFQLVKLTPENQWTLDEVFQDRYENDDQGNIAAAFIVFAFKELGEEKFWSFYEQVNMKNCDTRLTQYFAKDRPTIEREFKAFVNTIPDPPDAFRYKYSPETAHLHQ